MENLEKYFEVDWERTCENINMRLVNLTHKNKLSEIFNLSERSVQYKLAGKKLEISELYMIAALLGCTIEDLIVRVTDDYNSPQLDELSRRSDVYFSKVDELIQHMEYNLRWQEECQIRNLVEFVLYLPLMKPEVLRDVVWRCWDSYKHDRKYFGNQMNYLYNCIEDTSAKQFADYYRDAVLRVKGADNPDDSIVLKNSESYFDSLECWAGKYLQKASFLKNDIEKY